MLRKIEMNAWLLIKSKTIRQYLLNGIWIIEITQLVQMLWNFTSIVTCVLVWGKMAKLIELNKNVLRLMLK